MKANFGQCYHSRGSCSFFVSPIVDSIRDLLKNIRKWLLTNVPVKKKVLFPQFGCLSQNDGPPR